MAIHSFTGIQWLPGVITHLIYRTNSNAAL